MSTEVEIHEIQAKALRVLLFKKQAKFSELNMTGVLSDHFTFHLKRLIEQGVVRKNLNGKYELTNKGKEFANLLDTETVKIEKQAKIAVLVIAKRERNGVVEYLAQQRLKEPFYGYLGFVTGKIHWGEEIETAAARELSEETGLKGKLRLAGVEHKIDHDQEGNLLEDKYFFVYLAEEVMGDLIIEFEGGRNVWMRKEKILKTKELFDDVKDVLDLTENKKAEIIERKYKVKRY